MPNHIIQFPKGFKASLLQRLSAGCECLTVELNDCTVREVDTLCGRYHTRKVPQLTEV